MIPPTWDAWQAWTQQDAPGEALRHTAVSALYARHYPALTALIGVPQDPRWHPEGDAFTHTVLVVDQAAGIATRDGLSPRDRTVLLLAAACHDVGKPTTTVTHDDGRITSYGHEAGGVPIARVFLARIGAPGDIADEVLPLVRDHMAHIRIIRAQREGVDVRPQVAALIRGLAPARLDQLVRLIEADMSGRAPLPPESPAAPLLAVAADIDGDRPA